MEIENEIWKPIVIKQNDVLYNFTGLYEVSNYGNIRSLNYNHTKKIKELTPKPDNGGYLRIGLHKNGKQVNCLVHRIVAQVFLENPNNLPEVNHKDENKENNNVENLEWCDRQYNAQYSLKGKTLSEEHKHKISEGNKNKRLSEEHKQKLLGSIKGKQKTEEHKRKISEGKKGKKIDKTTGEKHWNATKVLCIETGEVFNTLKEASEWLGIHYTNISKCCRGITKTCGGYHWQYI